jgi:cell wall-associated NlpC family hydrolase
MPFVGWSIFLVGMAALYSAYKDQKLTDVIRHAINPSLAAPVSISGGESPNYSGSSYSVGSAGNVGSTSAAAAAAVAYAAAQLGKPYRWAAAGPNSFDCSGLTMMAYRAAGKILPHQSQVQYLITAGSSLPIGQGTNFPTGSLVFFGSSKATIDHVGLVVGPDQMIEAPHTGDVVKYYSISAEGNLVAATNWLG